MQDEGVIKAAGDREVSCGSAHSLSPCNTLLLLLLLERVHASRYSGFIVLYPIGVSSELTMAWLALPHIKKTGLWSVNMPNSWNFGFSYWVANIIIMLTYLPGACQSIQCGCLYCVNQLSILLLLYAKPVSLDMFPVYCWSAVVLDVRFYTCKCVCQVSEVLLIAAEEW